ncbi:lipid-A-disaccharide synthase [Endothiovibrio diazotrophicus]
MTKKRIMMVAGEASGDDHTAGLALELKRLLPEAEFFGVGGERMRAAGVETLIDISELSVMGLVEVLKHYRRLMGIVERLRQVLRERRPDLLILTDYPEFNLKLAETAKGLGIPVLFYVSPQVWAWRPKRVKKIGARIDRMAVLFPFETAIYEQNGIPVDFVGHPLADHVQVTMSREEARAALGIEGPGPVIGLLPGSRRGEVQRLLPVLIESARQLRERYPDARFPLARASTRAESEFLPLLAEAGLPIELVSGQAQTVMRASDAVITASGTATLEIALVGTPMVIVYKMAPLTFAIMRRMMTIHHVGLANIVSGEEVARELLQDDATPEAIAAEVERILEDDAYRERITAKLGEVRGKLGSSGASRKVATVAARMLGTC